MPLQQGKSNFIWTFSLEVETIRSTSPLAMGNAHLLSCMLEIPKPSIYCILSLSFSYCVYIYKYYIIIYIHIGITHEENTHKTKSLKHTKQKT